MIMRGDLHFLNAIQYELHCKIDDMYQRTKKGLKRLLVFLRNLKILYVD